MGNTKEYPENVWIIVSKKRHSTSHTPSHLQHLQQSTTTKKNKKLTTKKRHNTQRSPNLGTQKQLSHACYAPNYITNNWELPKKDATALSCLRGTRYACVRVEIVNLFPHSTVLDPKGFRRKIGQSRSVCLSGFSYDTWYMHSINQSMYKQYIHQCIHNSYSFNYLVFYNLIPN